MDTNVTVRLPVLRTSLRREILLEREITLTQATAPPVCRGTVNFAAKAMPPGVSGEGKATVDLIYPTVEERQRWQEVTLPFAVFWPEPGLPDAVSLALRSRVDDVSGTLASDVFALTLILSVEVDVLEERDFRLQEGLLRPKSS